MPLEYIKSKQGKDQLFYNGYLHRKERLIGKKTLWKCAEYYKYHCMGRAHTYKNQVVKFVPHLHPPSKMVLEAKKVACGAEMGSSSQESTHKALVTNPNGLPNLTHNNVVMNQNELPNMTHNDVVTNTNGLPNKKLSVQNVKQTIQRLKICLISGRRATCGLQTTAPIAETGSQDPPLDPKIHQDPPSSNCPDGFVDMSCTTPITSNKMNGSRTSRIQASQEAGRQRFRLDTILPGEAPLEILSRLSEAAHQWLCPHEHDKDQIVDMVILEQFLNVLPVDIQAWVRAREPGSSMEVAQLAEAYLKEQKATETTQAPVTFEDVFVHFTEDEWSLLDHEEKKNYWDIMHQNYDNVAWLGECTDNKDPWQVDPEPRAKLSEKIKEEISESPEQDLVGKNCLGRNLLPCVQQISSGTKEVVHYPSVLTEIVREPEPEAMCICADCENWDTSSILITSHRHPVKEDPVSMVLSEEFHERFEKKGSQNLEQNFSTEDFNNQQPNHPGNEQSKCMGFRNVLENLVHQDRSAGQEVHCVCIDDTDHQFPILVNNQEVSSGKDSEYVVLSEELLQKPAGISQSPEQANAIHSEESSTEMDGTATLMGENQNSLVSMQHNHSGKQERQERSVTLGNCLGEQMGDVLHLDPGPGSDLQNPHVNCGHQDEYLKYIHVQKSIHRDDLDRCERGFTQRPDPATQSCGSHSCGLSASVKHRRLVSKRKGVRGSNACIKSNLELQRGIYLRGKLKKDLKRENYRHYGCSPLGPGRAPQEVKHEQKFSSLPKTAAEPTVAELMAVLQQVAMDTAEIKSSVASLCIIQNALGNLSGSTDEAEHRISNLEDTSWNTKAQLVQHCNDIKALEAKLTGKANGIAGLWSSVRGSSPLNLSPNS